MAVIGSGGLSLLVGDGAGSETFHPLKGAAITQLEIGQRNHISPAVSMDAWQVSGGISTRHASIECEAYATDDDAALRLRALMISGERGNFKLELSGDETLTLAAVVTLYREVIGAGGIKKLQVRLESSGALTII